VEWFVVVGDLSSSLGNPRIEILSQLLLASSYSSGSWILIWRISSSSSFIVGVLWSAASD